MKFTEARNVVNIALRRDVKCGERENGKHEEWGDELGFPTALSVGADASPFTLLYQAAISPCAKLGDFTKSRFPKTRAISLVLCR